MNYSDFLRAFLFVFILILLASVNLLADENLRIDDIEPVLYRDASSAGTLDILFDLPVVYSTGGRPSSITSADFNGDGIFDIVTANSDSDNISVYLGNGDGTFAGAANYSAGDRPICVRSADFDNDGDVDLATANSMSGNFSIILGNGDGTFNPAVNYSASSYPSSIFCADFDDDMDIDLAVVKTASDSVSIFSGNGDGTFAFEATYSAGNSPKSVTGSDFDSDGDLDIAIANSESDDISVYLGNGDCTFGSQTNYNAGDYPLSVISSDIDGDGYIDLVVLNFMETSVDIFTGNGDGTFSYASGYNTGVGPRSVTAADFDGDGDVDLVVANENSDYLSILSGNGDGTFDFGVKVVTDDSPFSLVTSDFDGDGEIDLAVTNTNIDEASILINITSNILITSGPAEGEHITESSTNICWTLDDNPSSPESVTYCYQLDGGGFSAWGSDTCAALSNLSDGSHTFEVRAKDAAENVSTLQRNFTVDLEGVVVAWGYNGYGQCDVPSPNQGFVAVAGSGHHSIGLKADGSVVAWGENYDGQCDVPTPNQDFVKVAAGVNHSIGLKADGSVVAWGNNDYGQCDVPSPNQDFVGVAGGAHHSIGLKADGSVVAWGYNNHGQCDVPSPNLDFVAVTGGAYHSAGLKADGSVVAWGRNDNGQCDVPAPNLNFVAIAAGYYHSVGLKEDGSLVAWGSNSSGQCDVPTPNQDFVMVAGGIGHSIGLKSDGSLAAWGSNDYGQCDLPTPNQDFVAVAAGWGHSIAMNGPDRTPPDLWITSGPVEGSSIQNAYCDICWRAFDNFTSWDSLTYSYQLDGGGFSAWGSDTCASFSSLSEGSHLFEIRAKDAAGNVATLQRNFMVDLEGVVFAWGQNNYNQCDVPAPNEDFASVSAGYNHSLGLKIDGTVAAWGNNFHGQCDVPVPNSGFTAVSAGNAFSLGLKEDSTLVGWGNNTDGRYNIPAPNADFIDVSAGYAFGLGLKSNGSIVAWGGNLYGQCDVPDTTSFFVDIAAGQYHSLGLRADGSILSWGRNDQGQCDIPLPNADFIAIAAGEDHSLGLKSNGTLVAWGENGVGQCDVPDPNENFVAVGGGITHSAALRGDGTLVAWGANGFGQCDLPPENSGFIDLGVGGYHSLAMKGSDTSPPQVWIASGPEEGGTIEESSVDICWAAYDNFSPLDSLTYSYQLDNGGYSSYGSDTCTAFSNLTEGSHIFEIRVKDAAGNLGIAERNFTVEFPAPILFTQSSDPAFGQISGENVTSSDYDLDGDIDPVYGTTVVENINGTDFNIDTGTGIASAAKSWSFWGDFDNDGDEDVAVGFGADDMVHLYRNMGNGQFEDITSSAGFTGLCTAGAWVDYNNDGWLDFFLFAERDENNNWGETTLLKNNGDSTFVDVTADAGLYLKESKIACVFFDCDNDGDQDLFLSGFWDPSRLFENNGNGTFSEVTGISEISILESEGASVGDYDNDGYLDILVNVYVDDHNILLRNTCGDFGQIGFEDVTDISGMVGPTGIIGRGTILKDFDNDGYLDAFLTYQEGQNYLWHNNGDGTFQEIAVKAGIAGPGFSTNCASADYNNDGFLDISFLGTDAEGAYCYLNSSDPNHWIQLKLSGNGISSNSSAIGSFATVHAGGLTLTQQLTAGSGFRSQESRILNFGLGDNQVVDTLVVRWPDGSTEKKYNLQADQKIEIVQLENVSPETEIVSGPEEGSYVTTDYVSISWTGSDNIDSAGDLVYSYRLDGASFSEYSGVTSRTFTGLAEGPHLFEVKARDLSGNEDATPDSLSFIVDALAPVPEIAFAPEESSYNSISSVTISWTGTDAVSPKDSILFQYNFDNQGYSIWAYDTTVTFESLSEGAHILSVRAKDERGNISSAVSRSFFVDRTSPVTQLVSGPSEGECWPSSTAGFSWTGADNQTQAQDLVYSFRIDGDTLSDWSSASSYTYNGLGQGSHTFEVRARDRAGNMDSSPASASFEVGYLDLVAGSVDVPDSAYCGREATMSWTVNNQGICGYTGSWDDWVYISEDDSLDGGDSHIGSIERNVTIASGESVPVSAQVLLPDNITGTYWLIVKADGGSEVLEEGYEDNNWAVAGPVSINIPPHPDLVVTTVSAPEEVQSGSGEYVDWTVLNQGDDTAPGGWTEYVYLSDDKVIGDDIKISEFTFEYNLDTGMDYMHTHPVTFPEDLEGYYWVVVKADGAGDVNEYEWEGNNAMISADSVYVTPRPYPDLVVSEVSVPDTVNSNDEIEISWTVTNVGDAATNVPGWYDRVYLSTSTSIADAKVMGEFENLSYLDTTQSYRRQNVPILIPKDTDTGDYYILVKCDCRGSLYEEDGEDNNVETSGSFRVNYVEYPRPDLEASGFNAPSTGWAGNDITVSWQVKNIGDAAASGKKLVDWVLISEDRDMADSDIQLGGIPEGDFIGDDLEPEQYYTRSVDVPLPLDVSGKYYIFALTDVRLEYDDPNWENNFSEIDSIQISVPPPADLTVTQVGAGADTVEAGGSLTINWTVLNDGTGPGVDQYWTDAVYLSLDDSLSEDDITLERALHSGLLEAGTSYSRSLSVAVPDDISGQWYLIASTDVDDSVDEGEDTGVNTLADISPLEISIPYTSQQAESDLRVVNTSVSGEPFSGSTVDVNWTVQNFGPDETAASGWYDYVYLSADDVFEPGADQICKSHYHSGQLVINGTYSFTSELALENGMEGEYYLFVYTDSKDQVYEPGNNDNNIGSTPIIVELTPPPDLRVTQVSSSGDLISGESVNVQWSVGNLGEGNTAVDNWADRLYLSADTTLETSTDVYLQTFQHSGVLSGGGFYQQSRSVSVPSGYSGIYYIMVKADALDSVYEHGEEGNNVSWVEVDIIPAEAVALPDLVMSSLGYIEGGRDTVMYTVENIDTAGVQPGERSWVDRFYLSEDQQLDYGVDVQIASASYVGDLAPQGSYTKAVEVDLPEGVSGDYYVIGLVDAASHVSEENEGNNSALCFESIELTPPDLVVTAVSASDTVISGQPALVSWEVHNQGVGQCDPGSWYDGVYLSMDRILDETDYNLGSKAHSGGLLPGGWYQGSLEVEVPLGISGICYFFVRTDRSDNVYEHYDEDNNYGYSAGGVEIVIPASDVDLAVTDVQLPTEGITGDQLTVNWTVQNLSDNDISGQWRDALYISADTVWSLDDLYLGEALQTAPLQAGGRYVQSITLSASDYMSLFESTVPGVMPGGYRAVVRTDIRNNIYESNEQNNSGASGAEMAVDLASLDVGVEYSASVDYGELSYYRLEVPAGHDIKLTADCGSGYDEIYIYVRYGDVPDRVNYDYRFEIDPHAECLIPGPETGSCYLTVYGHYVPYGGQFTLLPESFLFSLAQVTPERVDNTGFVTFDLTGGHLDDAAAVLLASSSGDTLVASELNAVNSTFVKAVFDLKYLATGLCDVLLINSVDDTTSLAGAVEVVAGGGPVIQPYIEGPGAVRLDVANTFRIDLTNIGTADAYHVISGLEMSLGTSYQIITDDGTGPVTVSDGSAVLIYTDFIAVGQKNDFQVRTWGDTDLSIQVLSVFSDPEMAPSQEGTSVLSAWVDDVNDAFSDRVAYAGVDFDRAYFELLQADAWDYSAVTEPVTGTLEDKIVESTLEAVSELNDPEIPAEQTGVTSWGLLESQEAADDFYVSSKSSDRFKFKKKDVAIRVARDPNEKVGPTAADQENFVSQLEDLPYTIYFENVAEAGATAQKVSVIDTLDADLDYRRFRLGEIAYGDTIIIVPENRSYYNRTIVLDDGNLLDITAGIDVYSGRVHWEFETIDPATGLPPLDPEAGFLPPNDSTGRGEGHVYFTIRADQDAADGTEIRNKALIVFDDNEPIITNEVVNVVRRVYPDLQITSTSGYSQYSGYVEGEEVTIYATVSNLREAGTVSSFDVSFWRGDPDAGGTLIGSPRPVSPLAGGAETVVSSSWVPERELGSYDIYIEVDSGNEIDEENETNNSYMLEIEVEPKTYTVAFAEDINMVSLPLEPLQEVTARSLATQLGATQIIRLDSTGVFETFIPAQHSGDGFAIDNSKGYIAVLQQQKQVTFSGITHTGQMDIDQGLNLLSLPLKQSGGCAARDFCELFGADKAIRYINSKAAFDVFIPHFHAGDGFEVLGARSYLLFAESDTTVTLEGDGWIGTQVSPPGGYMSSLTRLQQEQSGSRAPVLGITGTLYQKVWDDKIPLNCRGYIAEATNSRTGATVPVRTDEEEGSFTGIFIDFSQSSSAAEAGDRLELIIKNRHNDKQIGDTIEYMITETDVNNRYAAFDAVLEGLPPNITKLYQNFPNPFNPVTRIRYQTASRGRVSLKVFDVTGRLVKTLVDCVKSPGYHKIDWNGKNNRGAQVASGVYFYRLDTPGYNRALKLVILR